MTSLNPNIETEILIEDPCLRPDSITAPQQTNPNRYKYTPDGITFNLTPLTVDPYICPITFSCVSVIATSILIEDRIRCNDVPTADL